MIYWIDYVADSDNGVTPVHSMHIGVLLVIGISCNGDVEVPEIAVFDGCITDRGGANRVVSPWPVVVDAVFGMHDGPSGAVKGVSGENYMPLIFRIDSRLHGHRSVFHRCVYRSPKSDSIFDLKILAANERQARIIEANFRRSAENYYQRFIEALSEERR